MMRRFRMLLPPGWVIVFALFMYAAFTIPEMLLAWQLGVPQQGSRGRALISCVLAILFGISRVIGFHPFYRSGYRQWLESTPWTRKKPLPVGPIRLVWEDVAILAVVWVPSFIENDFSSPFILPIVFVSAYLLALAPALIATESWVSGYAILYGLGASVFLYKNVNIVAEFTLGLFLIGQIGLWRSLGRFPWKSEWLKRADAAFKLQASKDVARLQENVSGWPFDSLGPKAGESATKLLSPRTVILTSILAGWWLAAAVSIIPIPMERLPILLGATFYGTGFALLRRLSVYLDGFSPPINIWGRIRTFRWIIPGFDKVLIAPVLVAMSGWLLPFELARLGLPYDAAVPIGLSLSWIIAALAGPNLRDWRLTGAHRIGPRAFSMASKGDIVKLG